MKIKSLIIALCLILVCFTASCNQNSTMSKSSEVDFSKEVKVNIEYKFEVCDAVISYQNGCFNFKYGDNCGTISGTEVIISSDEYKICSNELEFKGNIDELNDNFLPFIIYNVLSQCNGVIITQTYDELKKCSCFEESVLSHFLTFEIYDNNGKSSYVLIIT